MVPISGSRSQIKARSASWTTLYMYIPDYIVVDIITIVTCMVIYSDKHTFDPRLGTQDDPKRAQTDIQGSKERYHIIMVHSILFRQGQGSSNGGAM
jgi:hypothetical protein